MTDRDKELERERYDARARAQLRRGEAPGQPTSDTELIPAYLRAPYLLFGRRIA